MAIKNKVWFLSPLFVLKNCYHVLLNTFLSSPWKQIQFLRLFLTDLRFGFCGGGFLLFLFWFFPKLIILVLPWEVSSLYSPFFRHTKWNFRKEGSVQMLRKPFLNEKTVKNWNRFSKGHSRDFHTGDLQEEMGDVSIRKDTGTTKYYQPAQECRWQFHEVAPSPSPWPTVLIIRHSHQDPHLPAQTRTE